MDNSSNTVLSSLKSHPYEEPRQQIPSYSYSRAGLPNPVAANTPASLVSEKEASKISGHATRAVFNRYRIVSAEPMPENGRKLEAHLARQQVAGR